MPATPEQLERRISRLERDVQAARGIGTKAKLRNNLNHGGYQAENMANPASDADAQNKAASAGSFAPISSAYLTTAADATLTNESVLADTGTGDKAMYAAPKVKRLTAGSNVTLTHDDNQVTVAAAGAGVPTTITVADESTDTTCFPLFVTAATGDLGPKSGSNLAFDSDTGVLAATTFSGSGASLTSLNGSNVSSGTVAAARVATLNQDTTGTAANATHVAVADNESTNENNLIPFIEDQSATGNVGLESDGDLHYNPSTGTVTMGALSTTGDSRLGRTGINVAVNSNATCAMTETNTATSGTKYGLNLTYTASPGSSSSASYRGMQLTMASGTAQDFTSTGQAMTGFGASLTHDNDSKVGGSGTLAGMYGVNFQGFVGAASTSNSPQAQNLRGGFFQAKVNSAHATPVPGSTIGGEFISTYNNTNTLNLITAGLFSPKLVAAGTVTTMYGIDVDLSGVATGSSTVGAARGITVAGWNDTPTYSTAPYQLYLESNGEGAAIPFYQDGSGESVFEGDLKVEGEILGSRLAVCFGTNATITNTATYLKGAGFSTHSNSFGSRGYVMPRAGSIVGYGFAFGSNNTGVSGTCTVTVYVDTSAVLVNAATHTWNGYQKKQSYSQARGTAGDTFDAGDALLVTVESNDSGRQIKHGTLMLEVVFDD